MRIREILEAVNCVVFDVGETLVDETRAWETQARAAGITPFTLMASLGALIERRVDHRGVWPLLGVADPPASPPVHVEDLYPDALACLRTLRRTGFRVGIAGNQPAGVVAQLRAVGFDADFIASSTDWGVAKPSTAFFSRVAHAADTLPSSILYIGDRLDNDVLPARGSGMRTALIRRGPWGVQHASWPEAALADVRIDALSEITDASVMLHRHVR